MRKIRTVDELYDTLTEEFAWRLKELADLKVIVRQSNSLMQLSMIRAGLPLTYAHWEGFVKSASQFYLNFVLTQDIKLKDLQTCFVALSAKSLIHSFSETNNTVIQHELVKYLTTQTSLDSKAFYATEVNTKSNLNSDVFTNIALSIGIDTRQYETKFNFLDESLLKRRNEIAHGNYLDLDSKSFRDIVDEVISLIRSFKDDLINNATLKLYLK